MIAVIADDFSGAAEIAGISLRFGLTIELCLDKARKTNADVLIVCSDSRSMTREAAINATKLAMEAILPFRPSFTYKKIDSVLRGYVVDELKVQVAMAGKNKAFILPANPSLDRTIKNGEYFIEGKKITLTDFVNDPEFPVGSASVVDMLNDHKVKVVSNSDALPVDGIAIGEANTFGDVEAWAAGIDHSWVLAGAGDFYTALLSKSYQPQPQPEPGFRLPHLYVCGTSFLKRKQFIQKLHKELGCVAYLPDYLSGKWLAEIGAILSVQQRAVIAIENSGADAVFLRKEMAKAVRLVVEKYLVREIFIEGGSTAGALLKEMNITILQPSNELSRGVVRMKAGTIYLTVKPGSYDLPAAIRKRWEIVPE